MESHQKYMKDHVNPMLESLVTALLLKKPVEPVPFMISWFSEQVPAASKSSSSVKMTAEALRTAIEETKQKCRDLEDRVVDKTVLGKMQHTDFKAGSGAAPKADDAPKKEADADAGEEDEDEDDVDDDFDEEAAEKAEAEARRIQGAKGQRTSVSAEAYGVWNKKEDFTPPMNPKSPDEVKTITTILEHIFMFSHLAKDAISTVVGATSLYEPKAGENVINEGEDGECLFVVEKGDLDCFKIIGGESKKVKEYGTKEAFGELALLYNCPRAATVTARTDCRLWKLDRETFNHIVKDASQKRMEKLESFVRKCPSLRGLDTFERMKICEALKQMSMQKDDVVVKEGDSADCMYFIESGECVARKVLEPGKPPVDVMRHDAGDFFGELALLSGEPRKATVVCASECMLLALDRSMFSKLIGSLRDILKRSYTTPGQ
jgi:cAMP-dependent protein kinase regulator